LESVIEEDASELETPASELYRQEKCNSILDRQQTSVFTSKRNSGEPLEETVISPSGS
jgi:hypothetical protein